MRGQTNAPTQIQFFYLSVRHIYAHFEREQRWVNEREMETDIRGRTHTHMHARMHACTHTHTRTHARTHIHTHTHTYEERQTHTNSDTRIDTGAS